MGSNKVTLSKPSFEDHFGINAKFPGCKSWMAASARWTISFRRCTDVPIIDPKA